MSLPKAVETNLVSSGLAIEASILSAVGLSFNVHFYYFAGKLKSLR